MNKEIEMCRKPFVLLIESRRLFYVPEQKEREELFMKKTRKAASNVNNAVNLISGVNTLPLLDKLFSNSRRIEDMDDIYFSITE